jgi:5-(carboxyamino)imidazole ribonucleotide synthase
MNPSISHSSPPPPRLGIIGGGQLARMMALAARPLGVGVAILERTADCPAAPLATPALVGDWNSPAALRELAKHADVLTLENEFVNADALAEVERDGVLILPGAATLARVQDKLLQKQALAAAGLAVPAFRAVAHPGELADAARDFGLPLVLKARRNGYDGKGNFTLRETGDISAAWSALGGDKGNLLFVEAFCPFVRELAIIITRGRDGASVAYPVVETVQRDHICHIVRAPAPGSPETAARAAELARAAVAAIGAVGSFGVEMFETADGAVVINELAPRVHNSGHYTIEGCVCSQFENHVRAVLGWPLGSPRLLAPAAVMVNLLGAGPGPGWPQGMETALAIEGAHVHLYGKTTSARGRKMGHVTALGPTLAAAEESARCAAVALRFGNPG